MIQPLFAPVFQPYVTQNDAEATCSGDDLCTNDGNDVCDDDVIDNIDNNAFSPRGFEKQEGCNDRQPVGLLGHSAPNAAANVDAVHNCMILT